MAQRADKSIIAVGTKYRRVRGDYEVRAIVDAEYVVVRTWSEQFRAWVYSVEMLTVLEALLKDGTYQVIK